MSSLGRFLASLLFRNSSASQENPSEDSKAGFGRGKATERLRRDPRDSKLLSDVFPNWDRGRLIGGVYEIQRLLGRGGFGVVYLARERTTGRPVAIKVPVAYVKDQERGGQQPIHFAEHPWLKEIFLREVRTWMTLSHPHVVEAFDVRDDDSTDYLPAVCMQYCAGGSLAAFLRKEGWRLTLSQQLDIAIQIAWALEYIHGAGFLHRDLKAANVLLATRQKGKPLYALVSDLGLVKALDACLAAGATKRPNGQVPSDVVASRTCGTLTHLAPEAWIPGGKIGPAVDIYAFGVLLYELFCGRLPFWGIAFALSPEEVHRSASRPDPRKWNPRLPKELAELMVSCLAVGPEARPKIDEVEATLRGLYAKQTGCPHEQIRPKPDAAEISVLAARQRAWARVRLGVGAGRRGDFAEAEKEFTQAEVTFQEVSDLRGLAAVWTNRALALAAMGRMNEALELHRKAADLYRTLEDLQTLGYCYGNQAVLLAELGRTSEALHLLREQQRVFRRVKDFANLALSYAITASVQLGLGDRRRAWHAFRKADRLRKKIRDRLLLSRVFLHQASVLTELGNYRKALQLLQEQEVLSKAACDIPGLIQCYGTQASIYRRAGNLQEARRFHLLEQALAEKVHDGPALARSLVNQGEILLAMGDSLQAKMAFAKAQDIARRLRLVPELVGSLVNEALVLFAESGGRNLPVGQFEEAERIARQAGMPGLAEHVSKLRQKFSQSDWNAEQ